MNVQDAEHLEIPEGYVGAIHDSDGKQLWGALYYDVSYKGDTEQTTYIGKNQINNSSLDAVYSNVGTTSWTFSALPTGLSVTCQSNQQGTPWILLKLPVDLTTYSGKTIRMSAEWDGNGVCGIYRTNADGSTRVLGAGVSSSGSTATYTVPNDVSNAPYLGYSVGVSDYTGTPTTVDFTNLILTIDESDMRYEPYVGGIPSPNPDYPQDVNVVTGTQTVTLTGGTVSEDYTVDLGSIELCKIGDNQDYIYKSNGNWYKHAEVEKGMLDSSLGGFNSTFNWFYTSFSSLDLPAPVNNGRILSNYFTESTTTTMQTNKHLDGVCAVNSNTHIIIRDDAFSTASEYQTWIGSHATKFYYALATATDTQITDTTLVSQLDAVEEFLRRYGYTLSVAGNLPLIIDRDAY